MSNPYPAGPDKVTIGVGTCIKIGFWGAFGALLFSIVVSIVVGVIAVVLGLAGVAFLPTIRRLLGGG